jgi:hypothetical protein
MGKKFTLYVNSTTDIERLIRVEDEFGNRATVEDVGVLVLSPKVSFRGEVYGSEMGLQIIVEEP